MFLKVGQIVKGNVEKILDYGAFIKLENGEKGLLHISEISEEYVNDVSKILKNGQELKLKIIKILDNNKISLSLKHEESNFKVEKTQLLREEKKQTPPLNFEFSKVKNSQQSFEDMMSKFKKTSDEKIGEFKKASVFSKNKKRRVKG